MKNTHKDHSADQRRKFIRETLKNASKPITAAYFAGQLSVSRQIIVSDVAILRATGFDILATPKGYMLGSADTENAFPLVGMLACRHTAQQLREELYTIVDHGATVVDVVIEHALYGELSGRLGLSSRYDVDQFMKKVESEKNAAPISSLTDGTHLHRIGCKDKASFLLIKEALQLKGFLEE